MKFLLIWKLYENLQVLGSKHETQFRSVSAAELTSRRVICESKQVLVSASNCFFLSN